MGKSIHAGRLMASATLPVAVTVLAGAMGGFLIDLKTGFGSGYASVAVLLALAGLYGLVVGDLLTRLCRRPIHLRLDVVAAAGLALGGLGGRILVGCQVLFGNGRPCSQYATSLLVNVLSPFALACLAIAIYGAVTRIRVLQRST
jgi:hypothetical protein